MGVSEVLGPFVPTGGVTRPLTPNSNSSPAGGRHRAFRVSLQSVTPLVYPSAPPNRQGRRDCEWKTKKNLPTIPRVLTVSPEPYGLLVFFDGQESTLTMFFVVFNVERKSPCNLEHLPR